MWCAVATEAGEWQSYIISQEGATITRMSRAAIDRFHSTTDLHLQSRFLVDGKIMLQKIYSFEIEPVASFLSKGFIGGFATGLAEAGPRALGHRSILSDARNIRQKERINGLIKQRQAFQPLAPICLEEDFDRFFQPTTAQVTLKYMLYAIKCKPDALAQIPAVVHADETARVQLVNKSSNPFLFELLCEYRKLTGIGVLINTSLNGKGEPIVNTLQEVYAAYRKLDLDFLVVDRFIITGIL